MVALALAAIGTLVALVLLWPSSAAPEPAAGFRESQTSAAESVGGEVVSRTSGPCAHPQVGRVFSGAPQEAPPAPPLPPGIPQAPEEMPQECMLAVVDITSGPDSGYRTLLATSGQPGEIDLEVGDKVRLAIHRDAAPAAPGPFAPPPPLPPAEQPLPPAELPTAQPGPPAAPEPPIAPLPGPEAGAPAAPEQPVETPVVQIASTSANTYTFLDLERGVSLWLWLAVAIALIVLVGRIRGLLSLAGLAWTLLAVFVFLIPALLRGGDPVALAITAGGLILFPVLFMVHGMNWKSASALAGTLAAMGLAAALASFAISSSKLQGLGDEDNLLIQLYLPGVSVTGLLMAGFIIGALGVLNDVTIAQASTVQELYEAAPESTPREVFTSAMRVGRDHIASMVYTLVLAYLGTALPLSMLLTVADRPLLQTLSSDVVATELLRSAIGAIALVLAVPITTLIAAFTVAEKTAGQVGTAV